MNKELSDKLTALKDEMNKIPEGNETSREQLVSIIQEIENLNNETDESEDDLLDKIKSTIEEFESEHPRATAIMNDIMVTLSNMGI